MNNDDLSHFEICKPGFYAAVCVELEIDNLAIGALLQVRVTYWSDTYMYSLVL